jgi:hypothetical protein
MSTYSPSLRIELITTGDQAGTWGNTTNTNLGGLIESAIAGYVSVSITSANQALTALNGAPDQSRNQTIALTTTTTAVFNVYAPPAEKTYVIYNASAYAATIFNSTVLGNTTAAGLGVTIPAGKTVTVWSDGTNFALQNTSVPTPSYGTNDTSIATAAFVQAALQALHPVGSIYMNATNGTNPSTLLGFGTWTAFGAGRVPVGFNAGDSRFDSAEETGGSYDATLPSHTHSWSGSSSGSIGNTDLSHTHGFSASATTGGQSNGHEHAFSGTTVSAGSHQHFTTFNGGTDSPSQYSPTVFANKAIAATGAAGFEAYVLNGTSSTPNGGFTSSAGNHSHAYGGDTGGPNQNHTHAVSVSGTTGGASVGMSHNHSVSVSTSGSNSTEGSSAASANIQPYITVFMWKRIA